MNSQFPFLPDAPDLITTKSDLSPYHEKTTSEVASLRAEKAIRVMAVACVGDHQASVPGHLDFSLGSLKHIDEIIDKTSLTSYQQDQAKILVAELGSYVGITLESSALGKNIPVEWHTCPMYYFSALRFTTKKRGIVESSPFALVVKRLANKEKEGPLLNKVVAIWKMVQE